VKDRRAAVWGKKRGDREAGNGGVSAESWGKDEGWKKPVLEMGQEPHGARGDLKRGNHLPEK